MANRGGFHAADMPARQGIELNWSTAERRGGERERRKREDEEGGELVEKSE